MDRHPHRLLALAFVLAAPLASAGQQWGEPKQPKAPAAPAPAPAPTAPLSAECQKLKADFLKTRDAVAGTHERDDARTGDGGKGDGGMKRAPGSAQNADVQAARERYEQRCGALTPDMTQGAAPNTTAKAPVTAPWGQQRPAPSTAPSAAPSLGQATAQAAAPAAAPTQDLPRKAGPAQGTGSSPERCAQLHQSMKDALKRKDACAKKDKGCKQQEQFGYEQLRSAYHSGCGEIPADAKPGKGKGRG